MSRTLPHKTEEVYHPRGFGGRNCGTVKGVGRRHPLKKERYYVKEEPLIKRRTPLRKPSVLRGAAWKKKKGSSRYLPEEPLSAFTSARSISVIHRSDPGGKGKKKKKKSVVKKGPACPKARHRGKKYELNARPVRPSPEKNRENKPKETGSRGPRTGPAMCKIPVGLKKRRSRRAVCGAKTQKRVLPQEAGRRSNLPRPR